MSGRRSRWVVRAAAGGVMAVLLSGVAGGPPSRAASTAIDVIHDGNRLEALRDAPVPCHTLGGFIEMLERPLPEEAFAMRLSRSSPPDAREFALCVTVDGTLVVGMQHFALDARGRRGRFLRGEIERAFPPLDGSAPWRWLIPIALSREVQVTLDVRAMADVWPVHRVVIRSGYER